VIDGAGTDAIEANLIIFDEKTIADRAIKENPEVFTEGMEYVNVTTARWRLMREYVGVLTERALRKMANVE
jgi:hypothetical protein